jgi:polyisoprenoid-binding protein YceI
MSIAPSRLSSFARVASSAAVLGLAALGGVAHAQSATYVIEPTHTFVTFEVLHFGTSTNRGRFDRKEGTVTIDRAAKKGSADITIDMTSINTGTPSFDRHLTGKDFFNASEFAKARFVGDTVTFDGDKVKSVSGNLTLLGKSQPVTLNAVRFNCFDHPRIKREVCGGDFEATIQRSAYGMGYGLPGIPDDVRLVIQVEAIRQ